MTKPLRPIYYDTETTGVRNDKDRIIELAAFDPVENRTFCHLINPGIPIPPEATAIHKITNEMVADALTFKEIGEQFVAFCPKKRSSSPITMTRSTNCFSSKNLNGQGSPSPLFVLSTP